MDYPQLIVKGKKGKQYDKLEQLAKYLADIKNRDFTGYIKVNFSQGNIGRVEKFEEILKNK
jgi:hypothetical protein